MNELIFIFVIFKYCTIVNVSISIRLTEMENVIMVFMNFHLREILMKQISFEFS